MANRAVTFDHELYDYFPLRAVIGSGSRINDMFPAPLREGIDIAALERRHGFSDNHGFFLFDFTFAGIGPPELGYVHGQVGGHVKVEDVHGLFDFGIVFHDVKQVGEHHGLGFHRCRRAFVFLNGHFGHFGFDHHGGLFHDFDNPFLLAPAEHTDAGSQSHNNTDFEENAAFVFQIGLGRFFEFHMVSSRIKCVIFESRHGLSSQSYAFYLENATLCRRRCL